MAKNKTKSGAKEESWGKFIRDIALILLLVLGIHSLLAKPFYIPSDSMMPGLLSGDRLIVSKYPYGWSYASASFHLLPKMKGRIFEKLPERGDIVVLEHPIDRTDYIKRVIGLPGDTIELKGGALFINGKAVKREQQPDMRIPVDANTPSRDKYGNSALDRFKQVDASGNETLVVPIIRETLPNGASYDTIDMGERPEVDEFGPYEVPAEPSFPDGRQPRRQRRQPRPGRCFGVGRRRPLRRHRRPRRNHHLLDRRLGPMVQPGELVPGLALGPCRNRPDPRT